jgi:hypothetical protein
VPDTLFLSLQPLAYTGVVVSDPLSRAPESTENGRLLPYGQSIFTQITDRDLRTGPETEILYSFISSSSFQEIQNTGERYELLRLPLINVSHQSTALKVLIDRRTSLTQDFQERI